MGKAIFKNNKGQSLVEFILVLPLVLTLVFGALTFGCLVYNKVVVVLAAYQASDRAKELFRNTYHNGFTLEEKVEMIENVGNNFLSYGIATKNNDVDIMFDEDNIEAVEVEVSFVYTFILPLIADLLGDTSEILISYRATFMVY